MVHGMHPTQINDCPTIRRVRFTHHDIPQTTVRYVPTPKWCMECTLPKSMTAQLFVGCVLRTMTYPKQPYGMFRHRNSAWNAPYPSNVRLPAEILCAYPSRASVQHRVGRIDNEDAGSDQYHLLQCRLRLNPLVQGRNQVGNCNIYKAGCGNCQHVG